MRKVNVLSFDENYVLLILFLSHVCSTYMDPRINTLDPVDSTFSRFSFLCSNPTTGQGVPNHDMDRLQLRNDLKWGPRTLGTFMNCFEDFSPVQT